MQQPVASLLVLVAVITALVGETAALKCYSCLGVLTPGMKPREEPCYNPQWSSERPIECSEGHNVCLKSYKKYPNNIESVSRGCGISPDTTDSCKMEAASGEIKCTCTKNRCNGERRNVYGLLLLLPSLLGAYALF